MAPAWAWTSGDGTTEIHGFVDDTHHQRNDYGIVKQRMRGQLEISKEFEPIGIFSELSFHGIFRATYDGVYDWNSSGYGDDSGHAVFGSSSALPFLGDGTGRQQTPWGQSPVTAGNPLLPGGGGFGFNTVTNPNVGLKRVGGELSESNNSGYLGGGLELFTPTRPCDVDPRGCIDGYMDYDEDDLRLPEFRDDQRWLREAYVDATVPFASGNELNFRVGRQQVVWGRTDLFRVLDQINPIDFSIQNIYEEFEDSRIPQGIFSAEYRMGATGAFDDLNVQFIWNFEDFQPNELGQGGTPYNILKAGDLFRALKNCYDNGCTVSNFAGGLVPTGNLATDFPAHQIGIRQANLPDGNDQFGLRLEGVFKSVGFSFNALYFYSQLPSLHGLQAPAVNSFIAPGVPWGPGIPGLPPFLQPRVTEVGGQELLRPNIPMFDIEFPRVFLLGTSADYYLDQVGNIPVKSTFRVEFAHTNGEEFADTSRDRLYSKSRVIRWVVGWDRPTFFKPLNPNRSFLLSAQMFGQHLLDHEEVITQFGKVGFSDWPEDFIFTFLIQGFYHNDRVLPRFITAYDVRAQSGVIGPQVDWLITDNWQATLGMNIKFGSSNHEAQDGRDSDPFPPFTTGACNAINPASPGSAMAPGCYQGYEPLGRFKAGPLGMAQDEDELQFTVRYRF